MPNNCVNFEFDSEIFNPISDPGRSLTNLRFHGLVQYRGQELYKVEFARTDLVTDFYFFNPESFLVSYLQRTRGDTEVPRTELFQYLEYRLLDGIPVAIWSIKFWLAKRVVTTMF
ncbi:MAG: hypothetical protein LR015_01210 [Verrucomicrobia bacterium]|nr:hypothetical protein [Verrucomicrobiota bacterium]